MPEATVMTGNPTNNPRPHLETIKKLLEDRGISEPVRNIGDYLKAIRTNSERWQEEDWRATECDEEMLLNNARIVGQVWFRGHLNCDLSLRPRLYREDTRKYLRKGHGSPVPADEEANLLDELFDLEHELRIDFTSYGHLLNEANQAKTATDWYFLMQHHGVPTRLLDWTTNALAALFFSLDEYRQRQELAGDAGTASGASIAIWMVDAYWLADHLSSEWSSPLLAWSADACRYIPPLETLIEKMGDSKALLPEHAMPIEPPAMHPRVAAQEGRFIIFGRTQDLVEEHLRLEQREDCSGIEELRLAQIKFEVDDVEALLRDLAQLGVSRRTLFPDLAGLADFIRWKHFHRVGGYKVQR
ncbi:MAG: FRG domain-containing protein [Candidatus Korobacteraceae bacterium]